MADLSDAERADLTALSQAVFPPEVLAALPGRHLEWGAPEGRVFVRTGGAGLVCVAGVVCRTALYDGRGNEIAIPLLVEEMNASRAE
jgi:hypothetical protein